MKHVFVETNWVFQYIEPGFKRTPQAANLVTRARNGEFELHIPAVCLREGAESVRKKCQPRHDMVAFRTFARDNGLINQDEEKLIIKFHQAFEQHVANDISAINRRLDDLLQVPNVHVFALSDSMLQRMLTFRNAASEINQLKPFDEAILAAVLVQAELERARGATDLVFCTLDSDLRPTTRDGKVRIGLDELYRNAGLRVLRDFQLP